MNFSFATPAEIEREFAERIRVARCMRRMTQRDLAERVGVSVGTIRNLERTGDCAFSTVIKVAQALHLERGLEGLFEVRVASINDMIEQDRRTRSARKRVRQRRESVRATWSHRRRSGRALDGLRCAAHRG